MKNTHELRFRCPTFLSDNDENSFFERLKKLACVENVKGQGTDLFVMLTWPEDSDFLELLALLYRYGVDMTGLSKFRNENNENWFYKNRDSYWHEKVFKPV